MDIQIDLQGPEAGLLLAASVSLADDDPSSAEEVLLRKYFSKETAESLEAKLDQQGISYPEDLPGLEKAILSRLKQETPLFQKRSLAVCLALAMADGTVDQQEMNCLNRYCAELEMSLHDVDLFREKKLQELNEEADYYKLQDLETSEIPLEITLVPKEAALALLTWTAFADDDPSEGETALIKEYFTQEDVESLMEKMNQAGANFPDDLPRMKSSILLTLKGLSREDQLKYLTLVNKTAEADGIMDPRELEILDFYCTELTIGLEELKGCAPLLSLMFRR